MALARTLIRGAGTTARNLVVITAMAIQLLVIMKAGDRLPALSGYGQRPDSDRSVESAGQPR